MALPTQTITFNNIESCTLIPEYERSVTDNIFKQHILLQKIRANQKTYDGGVRIDEPLGYGKVSGGTYGRTTTFTTELIEHITTLSLDPAHYEVHISVAKTDMDANSGDNATVNLLTATFENARSKMEELQTTGLFSGDGTSNALLGLDTWFPNDPTTGTIGGINRANETWFQSQTKDMTSLASLTMKKLQQLYGLCSDGIIKPNLGITTQLVYDEIWELATAQQRQGVSSVAKLGFVNIEFNGIPIVVDKNCTAAKIFFLNTKYLYLKSLSKDDLMWGPWLHPSNQLAKTKYLTWTGQLICNNSRYQGVGFNLS